MLPAQYFIPRKPKNILFAGEKISGHITREKNSRAIETVATILKTSLGPKGLDKMLIDEAGSITVTNDGATILKLLDISDPAAKLVTQMSRSQDRAVGDGTTSVAILASELVKAGTKLISDGLHPAVVTAGFVRANREAVKFMKENLAILCDENGNVMEQFGKDVTKGKETYLAKKEMLSKVKDKTNKKDSKDIDNNSNTNVNINKNETINNDAKFTDKEINEFVSIEDFEENEYLNGNNKYRTETKNDNQGNESKPINRLEEKSDFKRNLLFSAIKTSLNSKAISVHSKNFTSIVASAALSARINGLSETQILMRAGGSVEDSALLDGYAINSKSSIETPFKNNKEKAFEALFGNLVLCGFDFKARRLELGVKINLQNPETIEKLKAKENELPLKLVEKVKEMGAQGVIICGSVSSEAKHVLEKNNIFVIERLEFIHLNNISKFLGLRIFSTADSLLSFGNEIESSESEMKDDKSLSAIASSEVEQLPIGDEVITLIRKYKKTDGLRSNGNVKSILLRGPNEFFLSEVERSLNDALCVSKRLIEGKCSVPQAGKNGEEGGESVKISGGIVAGAGSVETACSAFLDQLSETFASQIRMPIKAFANALMVIPEVLATNSGKNAILVCSKLKQNYEKFILGDSEEVDEMDTDEGESDLEQGGSFSEGTYNVSFGEFDLRGNVSNVKRKEKVKNVVEENVEESEREGERKSDGVLEDDLKETSKGSSNVGSSNVRGVSQKHRKTKFSRKYVGVSSKNNKLLEKNVVDKGIVEPMLNKLKQLEIATEAALSILRIDECIELYPKEKKKPKGY